MYRFFLRHGTMLFSVSLFLQAPSKNLYAGAAFESQVFHQIDGVDADSLENLILAIDADKQIHQILISHSSLKNLEIKGKTWVKGVIGFDLLDPTLLSRPIKIFVDKNQDGNVGPGDPQLSLTKKGSNLSTPSFAPSKLGSSSSIAAIHLEPDCACSGKSKDCHTQATYCVHIFDSATGAVLWGSENITVTTHNTCGYTAVLGKTVPLSAAVKNRDLATMCLSLECVDGDCSGSQCLPLIPYLGKGSGGGGGGPQGPAGPRGPEGPKGDRGEPGIRGFPGPPGLPGATGPGGGGGGEKGATGATGAPGIPGPTGQVGPAGPAGDGSGGATGPVGPTGLQGGTGPSGMNGLTGATGPSGISGEAGKPGNPGPTGPQGPIGVTGPGGEGSLGPIGPTGLAGPTGPRGDDGRDGSNGGVGPAGPRGLTGPTGSSGPVGIPGPVGADGPSGRDGQQGATGPTGARGVTGVKGDPGVEGQIGPPGPNGQRGATGPSGVTGSKGEKGDLGSVGPTGQRGVTGRDGPGGAPGGQGPPGASIVKSCENAEQNRELCFELRGPAGAQYPVLFFRGFTFCPKEAPADCS